MNPLSSAPCSLEVHIRRGRWMGLGSWWVQRPQRWLWRSRGDALGTAMLSVQPRGCAGACKAASSRAGTHSSADVVCRSWPRPEGMAWWWDALCSPAEKKMVLGALIATVLWAARVSCPPWASLPLFLFGMSRYDPGLASFSLMPESCVPSWWCGSLWFGLEGTFRVT